MMGNQDYSSERRQMVAQQITARGICDSRLLAVMETVPRHRFVSQDELRWAHSDGPLPIGHGQTISQPYIVALMTDLLHLTGEENVLEVGTGCGYHAAVLSQMAMDVHTVEIIAALAEQATKTLADLGYDNIHVHLGDGSNGWLEAAPYDAIIVAAAAPQVPKPLLEQLADGGRMVLPVGSRGVQELEVWRREGAAFSHQANIPVAFVPLRGKYGWN